MNKLNIITKALDEKLGQNIIAIDMQQTSPIYDTFVICSAKNERMLQSLKDNVEDKMADKGYNPKKIEGLKSSKWILMDYGDIVVHIFEENERNNYNLEKLWSDMPLISLEGK